MSSKTAYNVEELVTTVNEWCGANNLTPASGQSAEQLSLRTLRYYRTMGLIDAPNSGQGRSYGEIHRLQLSAIRVLQAQGLPLRRIQTLLYGRSEAELRKVLDKGILAAPTQAPLPTIQGAEDWRILPFDDSVWLVLRHGRNLSHDQIFRIQAILDNSPNSEDSAPLEPERTH
jgi:DNA-binding transcriptional MerR regulator